MRRAIVTGFGPFLDIAHNPSGAAARAAADELERLGWAVELAILPVTWGAALRAPDPERAIGLHFGVARRRTAICVERRALAACGATPDIDGRRWSGPSEGDALTALDASAVARALGEAGREARVSDDAGDYVCNALYYASLCARRGRALFVHIPDEPDERAAPIGLLVARAVEAIYPGLAPSE